MSQQQTSGEKHKTDEAGQFPLAEPPRPRPLQVRRTDGLRPATAEGVTRSGSHNPRDPAASPEAKEALLRLARALARAAARDQVEFERRNKMEIEDAGEDRD